MSEHSLPNRAPQLRCLTAFGLAVCVLIPGLMIVLGHSTNVHASIYSEWYVSQSGGNTTCDSWLTACTTIQGAYDKASSGDRINVAAGTYSERIIFFKSLTILGTHPDVGSVTVITGSSSSSGPVLTINSGQTLTLTGVTIHNAQYSNYGGGIINYGIIKMTDVYLTEINNTGSGGGIYNTSTGKAVLTDVLISANTAMTNGAGIQNQGVMTLTNVTIGDNTAANRGGGIHTLGTIILNSVIITGNTAGTDGGGIATGAPTSTTLNNVSLIGNTANGASFGGGGIYNASKLLLTDVTFERNQASTGAGGGLLNHNASIVSLNRVVFNSNTSAVSGGGISNVQSNLSLANVTLSDNETNGETIINGGGGIMILYGVVTITNSTIAYNEISSGTNAGGVSNVYGTLTMDNNIIAFNDNANCSGTILSYYERNLNNVEDYSCNSAENLIGVDPLLGPLQDNGGKTKTHALQHGSPAIDSGENNRDVCSTTDQRNIIRPLDGDADGTATCDIGAFEVANTIYLPILLR